MTFQDFIESLTWRLRKAAVLPSSPASLPEAVARLGGARAVVDQIERAPIFLLGEGDEVVRVIEELRRDLVEDLADGLMIPFPSIAVALELSTGWMFHWLHRLGEGVQGDRFAHLSFDEKHAFPGFPDLVEFEFGGRKGEEFRIHVREETVERYRRVDRDRSIEETTQDIAKIVGDTMIEVALISHPNHYLVERTPALSPREERQAARGEPRPLRKRPHFIVIDYDGLVDLNPATRVPAGAHRPPVPHERRGHWMRLSEKCHHARAAGKTRVWVRETYVGEREFADGKNRYRVFLSPRELDGARGGP